MTRLFHFLRSDLFLSLAGGFALGLAGMALIPPASATQEKNDMRAVLVESTGQGANSDGQIAD